jgi:hypothetical protein
MPATTQVAVEEALRKTTPSTVTTPLARGLQPSQANGFSGVVAYELEPLAIEPPPDAPWRWAIQVDSRAGKAGLPIARPRPEGAARDGSGR